MSYTIWLDYLKSAAKSSVIQNDVRKILYRFPDKNEMIEEYSMSTGIVLKRVWKRKRDVLTFNTNDNELAGDGLFQWEYELGDFTRPLHQNQEFVVKESSTEVFVIIRTI